jgi:flagellar biosynthesis chaperone FliJ
MNIFPQSKMKEILREKEKRRERKREERREIIIIDKMILQDFRVSCNIYFIVQLK